jgi:hypothetical protein
VLPDCANIDYPPLSGHPGMNLDVGSGKYKVINAINVEAIFTLDLKNNLKLPKDSEGQHSWDKACLKTGETARLIITWLSSSEKTK